MGKLRHREGKALGGVHKAAKCQSKDLNSDILALVYVLKRCLTCSIIQSNKFSVVYKLLNKLLRIK